MAVSVFAHVSGTGTTGAISTTGATLLVAVNDGGSAGAPSDSAGNTWTLIDSQAGGSFSGTAAMYYVNNPTTSGSHTFTSNGGLSAVFVIAVSGTDTSAPFETSTKVASSQSLSITPANSGSLLVATLQIGGATVTGINSGFTIQDNIPGSGGVTYGGVLATLVQGAAAAVAPLWSPTSSGGNVFASFKPGTGGGGGGKPWLYYDAMSRNYCQRQKSFSRQRDSGLWVPNAPLLRAA